MAIENITKFSEAGKNRESLFIAINTIMTG